MPELGLADDLQAPRSDATVAILADVSAKKTRASLLDWYKAESETTCASSSCSGSDDEDLLECSLDGLPSLRASSMQVPRTLSRSDRVLNGKGCREELAFTDDEDDANVDAVASTSSASSLCDANPARLLRRRTEPDVLRTLYQTETSTKRGRLSLSDWWLEGRKPPNGFTPSTEVLCMSPKGSRSIKATWDHLPASAQAPVSMPAPQMPTCNANLPDVDFSFWAPLSELFRDISASFENIFGMCISERKRSTSRA